MLYPKQKKKKLVLVNLIRKLEKYNRYKIIIYPRNDYKFLFTTVFDTDSTHFKLTFIHFVYVYRRLLVVVIPFVNISTKSLVTYYTEL